VLSRRHILQQDVVGEPVLFGENGKNSIDVVELEAELVAQTRQHLKLAFVFFRMFCQVHLDPPPVLEEVDVLSADVLFELFKRSTLFFQQIIIFVSDLLYRIVHVIVTMLKLHHSFLQEFKVLGQSQIRELLLVRMCLVQIVNSLTQG